MARNEHEDVSNLNLPSEKPYTTFYLDIDGNAHLIQIDDYCAKYTETSNGNKRYWIKTYGSSLFNSENSSDLNYNRRLDWKFKNVNKNCFELYERFLKTKSKVYLHQAERLI